MAVIGLVIFTAAVAIFTAFHSAPIPYVRQEVDYPVRLLGSFGFGLAISNLEKMTETALKMERIESYPQQIELPESPTPHLDALTTMLDEPSHDTAGSDGGYYGEESNEAPVTDFPNLPGPTIFIVRESPVTRTTQAPPVYDGPAGLMDFTQSRKTAPPKVDGFGPINITVNYMAMATFASLFLVIASYLFWLKAVAHAAHRNSVEEINRASAKAKEEIDRIVSEIQSHQAGLVRALEDGDKEVAKTISQIPRHRSRLLDKVSEAEMEMDRAIGKGSAPWLLMLHRQDEIERLCANAKDGMGQLEDKIAEMARQHLRLPKPEALLSKELDPFKKLVAESKVDVEALVSDTRKNIEAKMTDAHCGELAGRFEAQKNRLRRELHKMEDIKASCPEIPPLRAKFVMLEDDITSATSRARELEAKVQSRISGLADLERKTNEMERDVKIQSKSLVNLQVCVERLRDGTREEEEKMAKIEEGPAALSDFPAGSLPDLPADLEPDLLGESSGSEAEEIGGKGEEERTEGPEEVAEASKDASSPKSPARKRRSRPSKRARDKLRARAQAAPPSSDAGGGNDVNDAHPSGK